MGILTLEEALGLFVPILVYWTYSGIYVLLGSSLEKYRLHSSEEEETKNLVSKLDVVKGVLLQQLFQLMVACLTFKLSAKPEPKPRVTSNSTILLDWAVTGWRFAVAMVVIDTWQYMWHRYMHVNGVLYKHVHSWHHRLVVPYAFGSQYNHPVEGFLLDTVGGVLAYLVSGMSPAISVVFFSFAVMKGIDDHCGMVIPGNVFHMLFRNNTAYHDVHHQLHGSKYNFSQPFFVTWDKILGTHMPSSLILDRKSKEESSKRKKYI